MERSLAISNYFIKLSQDSGKSLTPIKLLKLCYLSQGWYLGLAETSLIDETIYAWKYGPVIENVYHAFKSYRNSQIIELYCDGANSYPFPALDKNIFLDKIWEIYGDFSGIELSALTHQPNSPWDIVWNQQGGKDKQNAIIPNNLIKKFYKDKVAANESTTNAINPN